MKLKRGLGTKGNIVFYLYIFFLGAFLTSSPSQAMASSLSVPGMPHSYIRRYKS